MSYCSIQKIENLNGLVNLRLLKLSHNKIEKIENLEECVKLGNIFGFQLFLIFNILEELYLEKNYILKIENLSFLSRLKKLELGSN